MEAPTQPFLKRADMKSTTSVVFHETAPLGTLKELLNISESPEGLVRYLNCSEVRDTNFGFLQLVPAKGSKLHGLTVSVPVAYVALMLQAENASPIGFLQATSSALTRSDPAG